jgi:hypothetical protein
MESLHRYHHQAQQRIRRMAHEPTRGTYRPMTAPETPAPSGSPSSSSEPLSTLRGAGVNYDARRIGRVLVVVSLVTLAVLVVLFTVAGVHKNSQINKLRHDGVPVTVTVSNCLGLMGGTGSNAVGYSCMGSFTVHDTRYTENLPGTDFHHVGSTVAATVVPSDPALVSPDTILHAEHASFSVFVLPLVLLLILALLIGLVVLVLVRQRRRLPASGATP